MKIFLVLSFKLGVFLILPAIAQNDADQKLKQAEAITSIDSAQMCYEEAFKLALANGDHILADSILFSLGKRLVAAGMLEQAQDVADRGINLYADKDQNSLLAGFYNMKAVTYHHTNKLDSALTYYLKAVDKLESQNNDLKAAFIRFNIGNIFLSYRDWHQADEHFKIMLSACVTHNDSTYLAGVYSALSATQFELGSLEQSKEYAEKALVTAEIRDDILGQMLSKRQLGQLAVKNEDAALSLQYYKEALALAEIIKMPYYLALIQMNMSEAYGLINDPDASIAAGLSSLEYAESSGFKTQLPTVYRSLAEAYETKKDFSNAYRYINLATAIKDETNSEENKKIVNELLVKYQAEKKDRRIAEQKLSIASQQKENYLYLSLAIFSILVIAFLIRLLWLRKKLNLAEIFRLEQEKEKELLFAIVEGEEQERKRLSTELHDGLSNILFNCKLSLSSLLKQAPSISEKINENISLLDHVREDTRRMAHNLMPLDLENQSLGSALDNYTKRLNESTGSVEVYFQAFGENKWKISATRKMLIFRAVQELVGNALKYARAKEIAVQLFYEHGCVNITIEDDGVGWDVANTQVGQGLKTLAKRLELMNASFDIDSFVNKGTIASIKIYN